MMCCMAPGSIPYAESRSDHQGTAQRAQALLLQHLLGEAPLDLDVLPVYLPQHPSRPDSTNMYQPKQY